MKPTHARKVIRARASRDALRAILPQDIGWGLAITRGDNIFFRGVLAARFTRDGSHITTDRHSAPIAMTDSRALTAHFRGFFFPADYTDAMTATKSSGPPTRPGTMPPSPRHLRLWTPLRHPWPSPSPPPTYSPAVKRAAPVGVGPFDPAREHDAIIRCAHSPTHIDREE